MSRPIAGNEMQDRGMIAVLNLGELKIVVLENGAKRGIRGLKEFKY